MEKLEYIIVLGGYIDGLLLQPEELRLVAATWPSSFFLFPHDTLLQSSALTRDTKCSFNPNTNGITITSQHHPLSSSLPWEWDREYLLNILAGWKAQGNPGQPPSHPVLLTSVYRFNKLFFLKFI